MATRFSDSSDGPAEHAGGVAALNKAAIDAVNRNDVPDAIRNFEQLVAFDPQNAEILSNLGKLYYRAGDIDAAIRWFGDACAAAPGLEAFRSNYLSALVIGGNSYIAKGEESQGIAYLRAALGEDPGHPNARVELSNALECSGAPGVLGDFMPDVRPEQLGKHVLVACMPKSGSSFLLQALCVLTGWPNTPLSYAYLQNEQELYPPYLQRVALANTVTQQHCRATGPNTQIMQAFGIRPVVLVRRLDDIVISMAEFYDQGATTNTFYGEIWPMLDRAAKYDLLIDHLMPWYASFYVSWERAARLGRLDCLFVSYEDMIADKPALLGRVAGFLELGKTAADCAAAVQAVEGDTVRTRFNRGGAGRGADALTEDQQARLRRLFAPFGDSVDLARIGLDS